MNDDAQSPPTAKTTEKAAFDDVMLAMDIVDTLRHRALVVEKELSADAREAAMIERLSEIYDAQGIDVPERILRDGVKALEEKRFVYEPPKPGLQVSLAKFYVRRDRWLKPVAIVAGVAAFLTAAYELGIDGPRERRIEAERVAIAETLPTALAEARDAALAVAETDRARTRVETAYQDGAAALAAENASGARAAVNDLATLKGDLQADLTVRVVSRPGERSGVFRIPNDSPAARNYYLIVEAVDARGRARSLEITSEEDRATKRVAAWGLRVPEGEYNRIAADKSDDQIIQNDVIGRKPPGALTPDYRIPAEGGAILEW
ncbi:MAG: DUF6384 family protein [Parvularculaceae bacterium]